MAEIEPFRALRYDPDRVALANFVLNNCPMVHVEVDDRDLGHKVFQVLNTRGRQPSAHDILKTELFERAKFSSEEADKYARAWTQYESRLKTRNFDDLLRQIRSLHDRQMRGNFVTGFCNSVLEDVPARKFLTSYLPRFVHAAIAADPQLNRSTISIPLNPPFHRTGQGPVQLLATPQLDSTVDTG